MASQCASPRVALGVGFARLTLPSTLPICSLTLFLLYSAYDRIKEYVHCTPLATSRTLHQKATDALGGLRTKDGRSVRVEVVLKCENLQRIGAFKIRGALNATLSHLSEDTTASSASSEPLTLFTHSSGNHAQAMALTARLLTTPARPIDACIIMPETASKAKKAAVLGYGARVVECPSDTRTRQLTCDAEMLKITQSGGKTLFVSPFDDSRVICGQGTAVLEAAAQIRGEWGDGIPPDVIITPVGGGGLLSGSAVAAKGLWQDVKVVAAEPEEASDAHQSFYSGAFVPAVNPPQTICDGLLTSTGFHTLPLIMRYVDEIMLADDDAIKRAMKFVWERMKLVIEPSSALSLAVILGATLGGQASSAEAWRRLVQGIAERRPASEHDVVVRVLVVISGGNVELGKVGEWFTGLDI